MLATKDELKNWVANDQIKKVIDELRRWAPTLGDTDWENSLLLQAARFSDLLKDERNGTDSAENLGVRKAAITNALLSLIGELPAPEPATDTPAVDPAPLPESNELHAGKYLWVSGIALVIAVGLFFLLSNRQDRLGDGMGKMGFFILLFPLAFSAAAFLFGAMRSYAAYSGKVWQGQVELGGPIVLFAGVIGLGIWMNRPDQSSFSIPVTVHGQEGPFHNVLNGEDGRVLLDVDGYRTDAQVDSEGKATLGGLPGNVKGTKALLGFESRQWKLKDPQKMYPLNGKPIFLEVVSKCRACRIFGTVRDQKGLLSGMSVTLDNGEGATTDENGRFEIVLPPEKEKESYNLSVVANGQLLKDLYITPSPDVPIELVIEDALPLFCLRCKTERPKGDPVQREECSPNKKYLEGWLKGYRRALGEKDLQPECEWGEKER